jgi:lipopolysaccharide transport system ATP-binding protein
MGDVATQEGRTVLFVSHNMGAIVSLCKQGIVLKKGCNFYTGTVESATEMYMKSLFSNDETVIVTENQAKIKIHNVSISSETGDKYLKNHQGIRIEAHFTGKLINPEIICIIENSNNQIVSFQKKKGKDLNFYEHNGTLLLEIEYPPLWLYPGIYSVYFWFLNLVGGKDGRVRSDKYPFTVTGETDETGRAVISPSGCWKVWTLNE